MYDFNYPTVELIRTYASGINLEYNSFSSAILYN